MFMVFMKNRLLQDERCLLIYSDFRDVIDVTMLGSKCYH
jgi:hypothetical protein